jgi:hypothetical protein
MQELGAQVVCPLCMFACLEVCWDHLPFLPFFSGTAGSGAPGASQQESANAPQSQPETRRARAFGAAVSALGLTNKAVQQGDVAGAAGNAGT